MTSTEPKTAFLRHADELDRAQPRHQALRQAGRARFRELPLPTPRSEDWRFTNVAPLLSQPFELPTAQEAAEAVPLPAPAAPDAIRLTFVNGWFAAGLSTSGTLPAGLAIGRLAEASAAHTLRLGQLADYQGNVFTALNTGLLGDGAYVIVEDGAILSRPIEILYVTRPGGRSIVSYPRTLIVAGKNSQAIVLERYLSEDDAAYFTNAVTEIAIAENAVLEHCKVQQESLDAYHVANTQAVVARAGNFRTHSLILGGKLVRNEVRVRFEDEGGEATVNGLYLGAGTQHLDNFTVIDHARAHCASHELYKGILADQAQGVFNGKIFVRPGAQKTDAKQTNKVLLLSDSATINTKPQLEIFADDVKCTHGATVGQLDADQLFYLRARGIPEEQARRLLTFAFANDIVTRIALPGIRDELEQLIMQH